MNPHPSPSRSRRRSSRPHANPWRTRILTALAVALLATAGLVVAQDRVITTAVSIEQDQLAAGAYTPDQVLQSGRQFFTAAFLPEDGHGEGPFGPRASQRQAWWSDSGHISPFLRLNGLDSQACFECHNSAGQYTPPNQLHRTQKPGGVGGSAGFASVLFGNAQLPQTTTHIVRAAPKAFGTGYVQELALEMTRTLQKIEADTLAAAKANPTVPQTGNLIAKGVDFGQITFTCSTSTCPSPVRDVSQVEGVSTEDLIVRPFQHKGVTATLRSFTKTALDFHFSVQPIEVVGLNLDCDDDDLINEMAVNNTTPAASVASLQAQQDLGNVAALSAFNGMLRPPVWNPAIGSKGEDLFAQIGCADCHVPTLTTRRRPQLRIELAGPAKECPDGSIYGGMPRLGSFAEARADKHPAIKAAEEQQKAEDAAARDVERGLIAASTAICPKGFYCIDLTNPGSVPAEFLPRLPANGNGTVTVPLYSDLKRHDMGAFLAQASPQQADDAGTDIANREWLTTKLWGVADNGPWLHDGRARTLEEAIIMHAGVNGTDPGSDAHPAVSNYLALSTSNQLALIDFLESLSVPPSP